MYVTSLPRCAQIYHDVLTGVMGEATPTAAARHRGNGSQDGAGVGAGDGGDDNEDGDNGSADDAPAEPQFVGKRASKDDRKVGPAWCELLANPCGQRD